MKCCKAGNVWSPARCQHKIYSFVTTLSTPPCSTCLTFSQFTFLIPFTRTFTSPVTERTWQHSHTETHHLCCCANSWRATALMLDALHDADLQVQLHEIPPCKCLLASKQEESYLTGFTTTQLKPLLSAFTIHILLILYIILMKINKTLKHSLPNYHLYPTLY